MTYEQARKFIEQTTKFGSVLGLASMKALMEELGNVQNTIPTIHIAGTNGKGSVGAYLAAIFQKAGLKTGRYCSPAVFHPLECWQYDGQMITEHEYAAVMSQVKKACDIVVSKGIRPTVFEVETAAAFVYFSRKQTDVLLLETGLGGETDATNVAEHPLACVFTNISRDHMQFLGDTLEEITAVKAGIIKPGAKVFSAKQHPEAEAMLERYYIASRQKLEKQIKTKQNQEQIGFVDESRLHLVSQKPGELLFSYKGIKYVTQLSGIYQMKNAALAIEAAEGMLETLLSVKKEEALKNAAYGKKDNETKTLIENTVEHVKNIISNGIKNTFWPGRFEILGKDPLFIMDGAHNEDAACMLSQTLENCFTKSSLVYIIGVLADKEHKQMLKIMRFYSDRVYTITPPNARALDAGKLAEEAREFYREVTACESIEQAAAGAIAYAKANGKAILAFGSLSYLSELKAVVSDRMPKY
uniref:bifunctional folylpolyglutamate synthase/dihydrofolate synthase n=1 Tax=Agathobacter sp. TaxID=2021311 RepID=UPI0040572168